MSEPRKKQVYLLEDFVAEKDAFGPHQRVADAIADMVATEAGGKAVAVIGTWGSGKSTVFNLLKKKLESGKPNTSPLTSAQQEILKRNLRDTLVDSDTSAANLLQLFGRVLADCSILTEKADDLVRLGFRKMLERRDEVELMWLKTVVSQCSELLTKCRPASKEDFIGRVRGLLNEKLDDKTAGLINSIAAVLRIKADEKPPLSKA